MELIEDDVEAGTVTFEAYVRERSTRLIRMAWLVTRDWDDARDAVQDAFVSLVRRWDRLPEDGRRHAYVSRTVVNAALTILRRRRRTWPVADVATLTEAAGGQDPATQVAAADTVSRLCAELPPLQRAAIVLRYYADLSYRDIAAALGCRESTARSHVNRAQAALRARMEEDGDAGR